MLEPGDVPIEEQHACGPEAPHLVGAATNKLPKYTAAQKLRGFDAATVGAEVTGGDAPAMKVIPTWKDLSRNRARSREHTVLVHAATSACCNVQSTCSRGKLCPTRLVGTYQVDESQPGPQEEGSACGGKHGQFHLTVLVTAEQDVRAHVAATKDSAEESPSGTSEALVFASSLRR